MTETALLLDVTEPDPTLLTVRAFRHQLRDRLARIGIPDRAAQDLMLAFQEHATNAISHGQPAPTTLSLRLGQEGSCWTLEITDDGGAFENFDGYMALATWADRRTSVRSSGMGLRFIGTRFPDYSYIPGFQVTREPNVLTLTFPPRASAMLKPLIVVIEDDPVQRALLKLMLSEEFRVVDFGHAEQALRVLRNHPSDLIVSDIEMPEMDGFQLRRELAKEHRTDIIPFVFLTAHGDDTTADLASDLNIDDFISKPIDGPALQRTARRLVRRARGLRERLTLEGAKEATESLSIQVPAKIGDVLLAAGSVSATAGGGDIVQTVKVAGRSVVLLADVMGHGLAARFFAHGVAAYFRSIAHTASGETSVDRLMSMLSDALFHDPTFARTVVSAQIFAIDGDGTVDIASAGHPFPVRLSDGQPAWVEIGGPLLGLAEELSFPSRRIELAAGERLLAYTDGLTEVGAARRDPAEAARRLFEQARALGTATPKEAVTLLLDRLRADAAGAPADDVSVLIIGR